MAANRRIPPSVGAKCAFIGTRLACDAKSMHGAHFSETLPLTYKVEVLERYVALFDLLTC